MITVLLTTVLIDLLAAVALGMVLACVLFMKKMGDIAEAKSAINSLEQCKAQHLMMKEVNWPKEYLQQIYVKQLYGPLFFGITSHFQELVQSIPNVKIVLICMGDVPYVDQSGLYALEDAILYLENKGITIAILEIQSQPKDMLRRIQLIPNLIEEKRIFDDFVSCEQWLQEHFSNEDEPTTI